MVVPNLRIEIVIDFNRIATRYKGQILPVNDAADRHRHQPAVVEVSGTQAG